MIADTDGAIWPLNIGGLMLACSPEFIEYVAACIATPPERGRYTDPTAGPLVFAARTQPVHRAALLGLVKMLDAHEGWA